MKAHKYWSVGALITMLGVKAKGLFLRIAQKKA